MPIFAQECSGPGPCNFFATACIFNDEGLESGTNDVNQNPGKQILEACRQGDRSAQKALYDRLAPVMYPVCIRYAGDREVAKDLLQDGFVTLFASLEQFRGDGSFEGWARRIFVNTALMYLRRHDALRESGDLEAAVQLKSDTATPVQEMGYRELMALVMELPAGFRTVFNMYVVEGYSHREIAEALGISEVTSRSQLNRARALLREKIERNK